MATPVYEGDVYEDGEQFKHDDKLRAIFFMRAIKHEFNSKIAGRNVYIDVPYVEILTPGSRDTLVTEATEQYRRRFPKQWAAFEARQEAPMEGTPLSEIPWLGRSQVAELNFMNVKTVEQLINMPDNLGQGIMGFQQLKDRAKRFMDAAAGEAVTAKLDAKIEEQSMLIDKLQQQVANLLADKAKATAKA
jgi:hypothetical protein